MLKQIFRPGKVDLQFILKDFRKGMHAGGHFSLLILLSDSPFFTFLKQNYQVI